VKSCFVLTELLAILGFRVKGQGLRVQDFGFRVWVIGFRV
jgi:hypothetical protein